MSWYDPPDDKEGYGLDTARTTGWEVGAIGC
jgi:hypothetical protein